MRSDLLRWEDKSSMKDIMNQLMRKRIEDKVAFRNMSPDGKKGHGK